MLIKINPEDAIICDLDGTLADFEHRTHLVNTKPKKFEQFYDECDKDSVIVPVWEIIYKMCIDSYKPKYKLIFVTGRPERTRSKTTAWLFNMCRFIDYTLYMRADGDRRPDDIIKQEILDKYLDKSKILFVLDDRQKVVDMWRRNGLTCLQVAEGKF